MNLLCNVSLLLTGKWKVLDLNRTEETPWKQCPQTHKLVESTRQYEGVIPFCSIADHISKYSCMEPYNSYHIAHFHSSECNINRVQDSLDSISRAFHRPTVTHNARKRETSDYPYHNSSSGSYSIHFVGDSLTAQYYIASQCMLEQADSLSWLQPTYKMDLFLRDDIPCHPRCLNDSDYFHANKKEFFTPCWACPDQRLRSFHDVMESRSSWIHTIPANSIALVLNTGAWYNAFKGVTNSAASFASSLNALLPYFTQLRLQRPELLIYWVGLPPIIIPMHKDKYGWLGFEEKDKLVREVLEPVGITFVNISGIFRERKVADPKVSVDGLHWCNPGHHSVPHFISQLLLHLIAVDLAKRTPFSLHYLPSERDHPHDE